MLDPTRTGGSVRHCTESMLAYHSGARDGSPAYAATSAQGRSITISVRTSTAIRSSSPSRRDAASHFDTPGGTLPAVTGSAGRLPVSGEGTFEVGPHLVGQRVRGRLAQYRDGLAQLFDVRHAAGTDREVRGPYP